MNNVSARPGKNLSLLMEDPVFWNVMDTHLKSIRDKAVRKVFLRAMTQVVDSQVQAEISGAGETTLSDASREHNLESSRHLVQRMNEVYGVIEKAKSDLTERNEKMRKIKRQIYYSGLPLGLSKILVRSYQYAGSGNTRSAREFRATFYAGRLLYRQAIAVGRRLSSDSAPV